MTTMITFEAAGSTYCLPVDITRAVRSAVGMVSMPAPNPNVAGLLPGDPPLTVISPFGVNGDHVLVVQIGQKSFGLLVDQVVGLRKINDADIGPAPLGQERELVSGSVTIDGNLLLVTDPLATGAQI